MGLIKAGLGSVGGVLADQWKEYFSCDSIEDGVLVVKGEKKIGGRSSNRKSEDNVISNGSIISVNEGQCMLIVESGKVVEVCAEPGEFVYDSTTEPSIFAGSFGESLKQSFKEIGKRFTFGGEAPKDQRVYYVNTKEIPGNKYGTPSPVPFRVLDANIGLDIDISIRCHGEYSYKITNPLLFYTNVSGNVESDYNKEEIDSQLKTELLTSLQPAFAKVSEKGVRYSALPAHTVEISDALNDILSAKWRELRGIEIVSFGMASVNASKEDEDMIKQFQRNAALRNPNMAAAQLAGAQAQAMQDAAKNPNGAMGGFVGMGFAQNMGGMNSKDLFAMGNASAVSSDSWTCVCGKSVTGNFCSHCGAMKPSSWICSCGKENDGKFCSNCGKAKVVGITCSKCGKVFDGDIPKFCSECGNALN